MKKRLFVTMMVTVMAAMSVACGAKEETIGAISNISSKAVVETSPVETDEVEDNIAMGDIEVDFVKPTEAPVEEEVEAPVEEEVVVEATEAPVEEVVEPEVTEAPVKEEVVVEPTATPAPVVTEAPAEEFVEDLTTLEGIREAMFAAGDEMDAYLSKKYGVDDWEDLEYDETDEHCYKYIKAFNEMDWAADKYEVAEAKLKGISYMEPGYFGLCDYGPEPALIPYYDWNLVGRADELNAMAVAEGEDSIFWNLWLASKEGFETVEEYDVYLRHTSDLICGHADTYIDLKKEGVINWREYID